jgi:hypothetical protein
MRECATVAGRIETSDARLSSKLNHQMNPMLSAAATVPRPNKRKASVAADAEIEIHKQKASKNAASSVAPIPSSDNVQPCVDHSKDEGLSAPPAIASLVREPLPPLGRIVIPAIEHKHKLGVFTCQGQGLQKDGFAFQSVTNSLPRLHPVLTKVGKVAKRQPTPPKQPVAWWKAQCVFRGLKQQGNIEDLQTRLRNLEDSSSMLDELRALEALLSEEFLRKNTAARDERWARLVTDGNKADEDAERFLREKYQGTHPARDATIIRTYARFELHAAAEKLGLEHESVEAPPALDRRAARVDKWIIIGPNQSVVTAKICEVSQEAERMRQTIKQAREEQIQKRHAQLISREVATSNVAWDVSGTWVIDCPYVQEQWGDQGQDECELVIGFSPASDGMRMWATFNFIALTGVFRFARHGQALDVEEEGDREECEDDDIGGEYAASGSEQSDEDKLGAEPPCMAIPASDASQIRIIRPSPENRRWEYKWRGSETGEGELQIEFEDQIGSITFGGPGGTDLIGEFESSLTQRIDFTGRKVGNDSVHVDDLSYEWKNSGEVEYERRSRARWH